MSTIQIIIFDITKLVYKYHVEVEWIICGKNLVVNFDFDRKFLLLCYNAQLANILSKIRDLLRTKISWRN